MDSHDIKVKTISKDDIKKITKKCDDKECCKDGDNICNICHDEIDKEKTKLVCCDNYIYHYDCIERWLLTNPSCPFCRKDHSK